MIPAIHVRRSGWRTRALLTAALLHPASPAPALRTPGEPGAALPQQTSRARPVRGTVVYDGTNAPVAGALVVWLVDGVVRARTLTDESGSFSIETAESGSGELRADIVGRPGVHVRLEPGDTLARLVIPARTIGIDALASAPDAAQCVRLPSPEQSAGILWREARTALAIDAWGRESRIFAYHLFQFERQLDGRGRVDAERSRRLDEVVDGPSRSRSADEVAREGYAQRAERGEVLFAPDSDVLLSPAFAETHCFRIRTGDRQRIGLAFESAAARDIVDIQGVFWLDRTTAELKAVEFEYTGLSAAGAMRPGGSLEYARLRRGYWALARWVVRSPMPDPAGQRVREEGVEVIEVVHSDGTTLPVLPRAALIGTLTDSAGGSPVAGAAIRLVGTSYAATTNAEGRFFIPELPGGRFRLTASDAQGEPVRTPPMDVRLVPNQATHIDINLHVPAGAVTPEQSAARYTALDSIRFYLRDLGLASSQHVDSLIADGLRDDRMGLLVGRVTDLGTGRPIGGVLLHLERPQLRTVTESNGTFAFADVMAGRHILTTEMLGYAQRSDTLDILPGEIMEAVVGLTTSPIALAPIEVTVRSRWLDSNGFYTRRTGGLAGHFFTRADIDAKSPAVFTDLLRDLPGVLVLSRGVGASSVYFRRVTTIVADEGARGCEPAIYYDGIPMNLGFDRLHEIPIPFIDGVEVYVGAATPIQFQHPCGVVLIWTRRPK